MERTKSGASREWEIDSRRYELIGKILNDTITDKERQEYLILGFERASRMTMRRPLKESREFGGRR